MRTSPLPLTPRRFYHTMFGGALSLALGCASARTRPHDMSVEGHEGAASQVQEEADAHTEQYDPSKNTFSNDCTLDFCWQTWTNPTSVHRDEADRLRRLAKRHRRGAARLREAEQKACVGVDDRDRDLSPFFHTDDIFGVSVPTLYSDDPVEITFAPVGGLTQESLQQLVDCHLARSASMGHEMPEMDYCPLTPHGVKATVTTREVGLVVNIWVDAGSESRREVMKRAQKLQDTLH